MPNLILDRPGGNSTTTQRELRESLPTFTLGIEGKPGTAGIHALRRPAENPAAPAWVSLPRCPAGRWPAMTAPIRHQQIRVDPLAVFKARAEARAILWAACEFDLHEAVDVLQADAVSTGLVAEVGQDAVQQIIADAFHIVRAAPFFISE